MKTVLHAEDREDDRFFFKRACDQCGLADQLKIFGVGDGVEAIDYLSGSGEYGNRDKFPLPDLIVLDLKMPRLSGIDVARWIKEQANIAEIPVIFLTASNEARDRADVDALGVAGYYVKPVGQSALTETVGSICRMFLGLARPTTRGEPAPRSPTIF